jgi:hypothetical protein
LWRRQAVGVADPATPRQYDLLSSVTCVDYSAYKGRRAAFADVLTSSIIFTAQKSGGGLLRLRAS